MQAGVYGQTRKSRAIILLGDIMYKYETHMHTAPVSRCGKASVEESVAFYKELGYDGIFIANHFLDGSINIEWGKPYEEKIEFYFSDYEKAVEIGKKLGIKVFCGVEISYYGTDFLIYGLDKAWYLAHPEIMEMRKSQELEFLRENGALIIQAHPFRQSAYIDHIRLFPKQIHGVEIINGARSKEENQMAKLLCEHYGLIPFAGSDNHKADRHFRLAGVQCAEPVCDEQDFIQKVLSGQMEVFTFKNEKMLP